MGKLLDNVERVLLL